MKTARQITLDLLIRMDTQGAYSNIILDHAFTSSDVDKRDKAFSAALFYGVLYRMTDLVSRNADSTYRNAVIDRCRKSYCICSRIIMVGKLSRHSCYLNIIKSVAVEDLSCYGCSGHSS